MIGVFEIARRLVESSQHPAAVLCGLVVIACGLCALAILIPSGEVTKK